MKKRKPPIVLGSILVVLIGAGLAFNASSQAKPQVPHPDQAAIEDRPLDKERTPDSKGKIMNDLKTSVGVSGASKATMQVGGPGPGQAPSIHVEKPKAYVPTNTDPNRTSGQWYQPESNAATR